MKTKEVEELTGLSRDTLRYYEREKLISPPSRSPNGYREYDKQVVEQLNLISKAKALGFTLKEIKELSTLLYKHVLTKTVMTNQLKQKKKEIEDKINKLSAIQNEIDKALAGLCEHKEKLG